MAWPWLHYWDDVHRHHRIGEGAHTAPLFFCLHDVTNMNATIRYAGITANGKELEMTKEHKAHLDYAFAKGVAREAHAFFCRTVGDARNAPLFSKERDRLDARTREAHAEMDQAFNRMREARNAWRALRGY